MRIPIFVGTGGAVGPPPSGPTGNVGHTVAGTFTPALSAPAGLASGDALLACFATAGTVAAPDGTWTQLYRDAATGIQWNWQVFWKVASGTDSFAFTGGGNGGYAIGRFPGRNATTPVNAFAHASHVTSSPTVTTTVNGCQIVQFTSIDDAAGSETVTLDAACTQLVFGTPTAAQVMLSYDTTNQATAGVTTARTITDSGVRNPVIATIALQP